MKIIDMDLGKLLNQAKKPTANPGGGALVITIAAMAVNIVRMMDRRNVSHETLDNISDRLVDLIQEDVDYANALVKEYKKGKIVDDEYFLKAARPQIELVELSIKALDYIKPILENGKLDAISDGIIANNLLLEVVRDAMPTIRVNLDPISKSYDYDEKIDYAKKLHKRNQQIIERRLKWQEYI